MPLNAADRGGGGGERGRGRRGKPRLQVSGYPKTQVGYSQCSGTAAVSQNYRVNLCADCNHYVFWGYPLDRYHNRCSSG